MSRIGIAFSLFFLASIATAQLFTETAGTQKNVSATQRGMSRTRLLAFLEQIWFVSIIPLLKRKSIAILIFCLPLAATVKAQSSSKNGEDGIGGGGTPNFVAKFLSADQ